MQPSYRLEMVSNEGTEVIVESERDLEKVRRIAASRSMTKRLRRPDRKLLIYKDGKLVRGGRYALDDLCYEYWLQAHEGREFHEFWHKDCPEVAW